jgi:hypothetical protein
MALFVVDHDGVSVGPDDVVPGVVSGIGDLLAQFALRADLSA